MINASTKVQSKDQTQLATGEYFGKTDGKPEKAHAERTLNKCDARILSMNK